jgi:hypothetical protein
VSSDEPGCRRCGALLDSPVAAVVPRFGPARSCRSCGWINHVPAPVVDIDLSAAAAVVPAVFDGLAEPGDTAASTIARYALDARTRVVHRIGAEVLRNPAEAVTWWLGFLRRLYEAEQMFNFDASPVLAIQQVYLHFLTRSGVPIFEDDVRLQPFWTEEIHRLVDLWRKLSACLREARLGRTLQFNDGRIYLPPTEVSSWAWEVNANVAADDRSARQRASPLEGHRDALVARAEVRAFGVSVVDALRQLCDVEDLSGRARLQQWGDWLLLVDLGEQTPLELRQLFRRFMLTRQRLSQQTAPDFLLAPDAASTRSFGDALADSAEFDWLLYAPVLLGVYGDHQPVAIVSRYLLHRSWAKAKTGIARRLVVAEQARRSSRDDLRAIAAISRQVHGLLEADAARCLREAGLTTVENLADIDGRSLDCGEIDVLATAPSADARPVVVVCEVKDTDLGFYKDLGPEEAYVISEKGRQQAQRKAAWVAANWHKVRSALGSTMADDVEPRFVALVVPRAASLPIAGIGPASVGLPDLAGVARGLANTPFEAWRPDLARAVVTPARPKDT